MRKDNTLTLKPEDYIVFQGGLKIENVGKHLITFDLPENYIIDPFETKLEVNLTNKI